MANRRDKVTFRITAEEGAAARAAAHAAGVSFSQYVRTRFLAGSVSVSEGELRVLGEVRMLRELNARMWKLAADGRVTPAAVAEAIGSVRAVGTMVYAQSAVTEAGPPWQALLDPIKREEGKV